MNIYEKPKQENVTTPEIKEVAVALVEEICQHLGLESEDREIFRESLSNSSLQLNFLSDFVVLNDLRRRIAEKENHLKNLLGEDKVTEIRQKYPFLTQKSF